MLELFCGCVEVDPFLHLFRKVGVRVDRLDRTFVDASIAVNAGVGVYVEAVGRLMKGIYGADAHAGGEFAVDARFGDNVGHDFS